MKEPGGRELPVADFAACDLKREGVGQHHRRPLKTGRRNPLLPNTFIRWEVPSTDRHMPTRAWFGAVQMILR